MILKHIVGLNLIIHVILKILFWWAENLWTSFFSFTFENNDSDFSSYQKHKKVICSRLLEGNCQKVTECLYYFMDFARYCVFINQICIQDAHWNVSHLSRYQIWSSDRSSSNKPWHFASLEMSQYVNACYIATSMITQPEGWSHLHSPEVLHRRLA